jgi:hypothetical protein
LFGSADGNDLIRQYFVFDHTSAAAVLPGKEGLWYKWSCLCHCYFFSGSTHVQSSTLSTCVRVCKGAFRS